MTDTRSGPAANTPTEKAVAFLRQPGAYPEHPPAVEVRETHMSWVFLTERHVFKLKKPVRFSYLDYATAAARRRNCRAEVRLNRRLAPWVYLGVVPLLRGPDGALSLSGDGRPVDWLVKMVRLPGERLLDTALTRTSLKPPAIDRAARLLADFYTGQPPVSDPPARYDEEQAAEVRANCAALCEEADGLPPARVGAVQAALLRFLDREAELLAGRAGRLVEGHGDLRPDHIYLGPPPAVIDCIEFNRTFRINDPIDELAFLAMECDRLGVSWIGDRFLAAYAAAAQDSAPARLVAFYKAGRALLRAKLAIWHVADAPETAAHWHDKARRYLALAEGHAAALD